MLAAFKTCDDPVWFPLLLDANTTIHAWQDKAFTMSANETLILFRQSGSGPHSDLPRNGNISLSQLRILMNGLSCENEESVDALQSYAPSGVHFS